MKKNNVSYMPLSCFLSEYTKKNSDNLHRPVAVGKYGIRSRESIYSKELASDYSKNKVIFKNTLTVGLGSNQIDIGILVDDAVFSVSPAYHTYKIDGIEPKYLECCLNFFNSEMFELYSKKASRQGKTIDFKRWLSHKIPVYSSQKQKEIVEFFSKMHELIKLENDKILLYKELIKSRFVEMFGNPDSNSMKWPCVKLKDCLENIDSGKSFVCSVKTRQADWPAILKLSAVTNGTYRPDENKALLNESQFIEKNEVHEGDLLFTRKNTPDLVGTAAYVYETPPKLMIPDLIFRLSTKKACSKVFLCHLINHDLFRNKVKKLASGSAKSMSNISQKRLKDLSIFLPPLPLQNKFAAFVECVYRSITVAHDKIELYNERSRLKSAMLFNEDDFS